MAIQLNKEFRDFISDAIDGNLKGLVISDRGGLELQGLMIAWIMSSDLCMQFTGGIDGLNGPFPSVNHYAGPKAGTLVSLCVCNGNAVPDIFNSISTVVLTATGGTTPMINGSLSPVTVKLVDGVANITVSDTVAGTVGIGMSSATHPFVTLDAAHLDTASVVLS
jgi:hypothetical protein